MARPDFNDAVEAFIQNIRYDVCKGSLYVARATAGLIKKIVSDVHCRSDSEIKTVIQNMKERLTVFFPYEPSINNVATKFLRDFEDECSKLSSGAEDMGEDAKQSRPSGVASTVEPLHRNVACSVVDKLTADIESSREKTCKKLGHHILPDEVIITVGNSKTVEMFLKDEAQKRNIQAWVVFTAHCDVSETVKSLNASNIAAYAIPDHQVFDMMPLVNKVIIGAHTVTSDGSLKCIRGTMNTVLAAKFHSVPVKACAVDFKFTSRPLCSLDTDADNVLLSPEDVIPFESCRRGDVEINNKQFDFVPHEFIEAIVSNA